MVQDTVEHTRFVGIDLSDKTGAVCIIEGSANPQHSQVTLGKNALRRWAASAKPCRAVLEAGAQSAWVARTLVAAGIEVIVADPSRLKMVTRSPRKSDRTDAEWLARLAKTPELLSPIEHRDEAAEAGLAVVQARRLLVAQRTALVNHVRSVVKRHGERLPSGSAAAFPHAVEAAIPDVLKPALLPLLEEVRRLTEQVKAYDQEVDKLAEHYPAARMLQQVPGVGVLTSTTFVLTVGRPERFAKSRQVGAYLGLAPRSQQSGSKRPQLAITKAGDEYLRALLVQCAHHIMGPFGKPSALRAFGERLAGGTSGAQKRRAVVAVARKLAVLLHRLWRTGEVYEAWPGGVPAAA